jgi:hypothetical protein
VISDHEFLKEVKQPLLNWKKKDLVPSKKKLKARQISVTLITEVNCPQELQDVRSFLSGLFSRVSRLHGPA